jgi:hypothetical protein
MILRGEGNSANRRRSGRKGKIDEGEKSEELNSTSPSYRN